MTSRTRHLRFLLSFRKNLKYEFWFGHCFKFMGNSFFYTNMSWNFQISFRMSKKTHYSTESKWLLPDLSGSIRECYLCSQVVFRVDATQMSHDSRVNGTNYQFIIFNFPHTVPRFPFERTEEVHLWICIRKHSCRSLSLSVHQPQHYCCPPWPHRHVQDAFFCAQQIVIVFFYFFAFAFNGRIFEGRTYAASLPFLKISIVCT